MNEIKAKLQQDIAQQLTGAPDSPAKAELIEELSLNLLARYQDLLAGGMDPEAAYKAALDDLGDTAELVEYLNSLDPGEKIPGGSSHKHAAGGSSNDSGSSGSPDGDGDLGGIHGRVGSYSFDLDFNSLMDNINRIMQDAANVAQDAMNQAKDSFRYMQDQFRKSGGAAANVHVYADSPFTNSQQPWEEELKEQLRQKEESVRKNLADHGITGDEAEELVRAAVDAARPGLEKELRLKYADQASNSAAEPDPDSAASAGSAQEEHHRSVGGAITSIDVEILGDIEIQQSQDPTETEVVIDGSLDKLNVRSENGVLTIRDIHNAVNGFMITRGLISPRVSLTLPATSWSSIRAVSVNGDVDVELDVPTESLTVNSVTGDLNLQMNQCRKAKITTVSGDISWDGDAQSMRTESVSGDIDLNGAFGVLTINSVSGDINAEGSTGTFASRTTSGDIQLETSQLPQALDVSTKSGDIELSIPDKGPFTVEFRTVSGDFDSDFFEGVISGKRGRFTYHGGDPASEGPIYRIQTLSGDASLMEI